MIRRQIELDEESDRILTGLAENHKGDLAEALAEVLRAHQSVEEFMDECEEFHQESLLAQKERAERDFSHRRYTMWDEIKRRNNL